MIDIITVVFREELPILKLQAESISLYCNRMCLHTIYVVINDDGMTENDIDVLWWGRFANRVKIIHRKHWDITLEGNGWLTQQLLKLLAAKQSNSEWSMVLDAKTIIIQPVELDKIFDDTGKLTWGSIPIFPVFDTAKHRVSQLFNINQTHIAGPAGIPFFFHNQTVNNMIEDIQQRTNQSFSKWFLDQGMITEFILYSGYIQYRDGSLDKMYVNSNNSYYPCNVCHSEVESFDRKYQQMQHPNTLTVSVHRNAWTKLTDLQKQAYRNLLLISGITCAKDLI
jgi:hypothetical protein